MSLTTSDIILKYKIIGSMNENGFCADDSLQLPKNDRETFKKVQEKTRYTQIKHHKKSLKDNFKLVTKYTRSGSEIVPEDIDLELRVVKTGTKESRLFLWWNLVWWSMPYQKAYGRQIRLLLWDKHHDAPFGLVQLQSPVLNMQVRDEHLGLYKNKDYWVNMSMNAQRIGALPPYNDLIGGKMAALSVISNEVRRIYSEKYQKETHLKKRIIKPDLLFVTTSSAFGKSSIYDRLKYKDRLVAKKIGYTKGKGTFHITEEIKSEIYDMLKRLNIDTRTGYGQGPSRKMILYQHAFRHLGLKNYQTHGIKREVYLFSIVKNLLGIIHKGEAPVYHDIPFKDIVEFWKDRWCIPRSKRMDKWRLFDSKKYLSERMDMITNA